MSENDRIPRCPVIRYGWRTERSLSASIGISDWYMRLVMLLGTYVVNPETGRRMKVAGIRMEGEFPSTGPDPEGDSLRHFVQLDDEAGGAGRIEVPIDLFFKWKMKRPDLVDEELDLPSAFLESRFTPSGVAPGRGVRRVIEVQPMPHPDQLIFWDTNGINNGKEPKK